MNSLKRLSGTLLYKNNMGNANAPQPYKTPEGYQLGSWQNTQKQSYKKGKLSPENVKRSKKLVSNGR